MVRLARVGTDLANSIIKFADPTPFNIVSIPARLGISAGGTITDFVLEKTVGTALKAGEKALISGLEAGLEKTAEVTTLVAKRIGRRVGGGFRALRQSLR